MKNDYKLNDIVIMKKTHPCGGNEWQIIRLGADIKIKCLTCNHIVMLSRLDFNKKIKTIKNGEL